MDTGKVKNFIIMVLAIANLFLIYAAVADAGHENEVRRAAEAELIALYEKSGVALDLDMDINSKAPRGIELTRDREAEQRIAESVIGKSSVTEQGGNIYVYTGTNGIASFRGTGEFEMLLDYGVASLSDGAMDVAESILGDMGMEPGGFADITEADGNLTVTLDCRYDGIEVYNARINFLFYGDSLMMVTGKRVFDTATETSSHDTLPLSTALVRFLDEADKNGYIFTKVTEISSGYSMGVTVSGDCVLSPLWYICTDTGDYALNAETGRLETIVY